MDLHSHHNQMLSAILLDNKEVLISLPTHIRDNHTLHDLHANIPPTTTKQITMPPSEPPSQPSSQSAQQQLEVSQNENKGTQ
jgi:hypothetical protein